MVWRDARSRRDVGGLGAARHHAHPPAGRALAPVAGATHWAERAARVCYDAWRNARRAAAACADLCLPRACVACDRAMAAHEPGVVCGWCWSCVEWLPSPRCERCGHPVGKYRCRWCDLLPPYVRAVRSVCWVPDGVAGDIVHALKYGGWHRAADSMADRMARLSWPDDVVRERALLVPVPLVLSRQRERGYNQSEALARPLAVRWNVPVCNALRRVRATRTQTQLTPGDRLSNVSGAFVACVSRARLAGRHVVLVDDVVTTAATLNSCAATLYEAGARIISYVTFGRARAAGDRQ